ncbi:MAG: efflux RND transporter periplasmic adaptor subunit, partial [Pseudomonadota bacterium]
TVEAEAVLVEIDVSEESAELAAARVEARRAQAEANRQRRLAAEGNAAEARRDQANADAAAAKARIATLETAIARKMIKAPFAGRVGITDLKPGQFVSQGDRVTTIVGLDDEIFVDFALPQAAAIKFDEDTPIEITLGEETLQGKVVAKAPTIDAASRSQTFRAVVARGGRELPAGSIVSVTAPIGNEEAMTVVPRTALKRSPYGNTVFVIEEVDGEPRAKAVIVDVGEITPEGNVTVLSGVSPGDRIAADGVFKLRDGALVNPKTQAPVSDGVPANDGESPPATERTDIN